MVAMSTERFLAIVYVLEARHLRTTKASIKAVSYVWFIGLVLSIPAFFTPETGYMIDYADWKHQFRIVIYSIFVPSDILCVLQKKQTSMQHLSNNRLPIAALAAPSQMDLSFNVASFWGDLLPIWSQVATRFHQKTTQQPT
jgi:hypothetical protein